MLLVAAVVPVGAIEWRLMAVCYGFIADGGNAGGNNIVSSPYRRSPSRSFGSGGNTIVKTPVAMRSSSRLRTITIRNLSNHRVHAFKDQLKKEEKKKESLIYLLSFLRLTRFSFPAPAPLRATSNPAVRIAGERRGAGYVLCIGAVVLRGRGGGSRGKEKHDYFWARVSLNGLDRLLRHSTSFDIVFDF